MTATNGSEQIPLRPITDVDSLSATVALAVNGAVKGEKTQGNLNGLVAMNGRSSKVVVSGSLLGEIAAQIGGRLVGLFTPASVDLYKVPQGVFVVVSSVIPMCIKPKTPVAVSLLDGISPERLLAMLTTSEVARGRLVAEGTLNGRPVRQYGIDGPTFLATAKASSNPHLRSFARGLTSAEDADLFVDATEGFPVAFQGGYTGSFEPLDFEGTFEVQIAMTSINDVPPVVLPALCDNPISM